MKQKLIALAIASALSAPAFADNANITVYGKAFLTIDQHDTGVAGTASKMRVNTNASRFGVKGGEDLGDGLKGIFQYEVEMDADGNTGAGLGKTRNSGFGLEGDFGKVVLGIWDSPFKVAHNKLELFDNTTDWSAVKVIGISGGKDFNTRQKNMVQYWSPKMGALQAAFMYSPDEAKTATVNKSITSMSATFDQDAIYVAVAYESRPDQSATGVTDTAMRAAGKFDLGDAWLGAMVESMKVNNVTNNNTEIVGAFNMGAGSIAASLTKQGAAGTDTTGVSLKYAYKFSKRTEGFLAYGSKKNGVTATTFGGGFVHSF
ncbi:MAG: porin [Gammaproteobacteria bacterium]|nr:porin [Gammaproteobacteria bacterium]MBU1448007.1 porin [Gammaproteobacteria bacterium]